MLLSVHVCLNCLFSLCRSLGYFWQRLLLPQEHRILLYWDLEKEIQNKSQKHWSTHCTPDHSPPLQSSFRCSLTALCPYLLSPQWHPVQEVRPQSTEQSGTTPPLTWWQCWAHCTAGCRWPFGLPGHTAALCSTCCRPEQTDPFPRDNYAQAQEAMFVIWMLREMHASTGAGGSKSRFLQFLLGSWECLLLLLLWSGST